MITLLLAIHNHQPVGNFDHVFTRAFKDCYAPLLEMLGEHPRVRLALHHSGCLLEWIEDHEPKYIDDLRAMVRRGQVEVLGGGFYEPILPSIPTRDAREQVTLFSDHLEQVLGQRPRGFWLCERVWEPSLPRVLAGLGMEYTIVDDTHFRYAGYRQENIWGHFITENEGHPLHIFPIDKTLRYNIPFREPEETLQYLNQRGEADPEFTAVYGDDGEKFGVWPGTREWVFEKGWLKRFFQALESSQDILQIRLFSEYLGQVAPRGRVYLPLASYEEMMEWSLPAEMIAPYEDLMKELKSQPHWETVQPFIRGGHWGQFLSKYPETNRMHKRMLLVSERLKELQGDKTMDTKAAQRELFRGQCNCAYWHGVFGGLYLGYLRHAVYEHLIRADRLLSEARHGGEDWMEVGYDDFDRDGRPEVLVENARMGAFFHPGEGGGLIHLEYRPKDFCLTNVLARRYEGYHRQLSNTIHDNNNNSPASIHDRVVLKEEGLMDKLIYDRFYRHCFIDHFFEDGPTVSDFQHERYIERGNFASGEYDLVDKKTDPGAYSFTLHRDGLVIVRGEPSEVVVGKTFVFNATRAGIDAAYTIINRGKRPLQCRFGVEFNLMLLAGNAENRYYLVHGIKPDPPHLASVGVECAAHDIFLVDEEFGFQIQLCFDTPADVFRFPIECVSQSESGFESTFQGSVIVAHRPLNLLPGQSVDWNISLDIAENI